MKGRIQFLGWKCWVFGVAQWNGKFIEYEYRCTNIHMGPLVVTIAPIESKAI